MDGLAAYQPAPPDVTFAGVEREGSALTDVYEWLGGGPVASFFGFLYYDAPVAIARRVDYPSGDAGPARRVKQTQGTPAT